jgi:hypothetical protein
MGHNLDLDAPIVDQRHFARLVAAPFAFKQQCETLA